MTKNRTRPTTRRRRRPTPAMIRARITQIIAALLPTTVSRETAPGSVKAWIETDPPGRYLDWRPVVDAIYATFPDAVVEWARFSPNSTSTLTIPRRARIEHFGNLIFVECFRPGPRGVDARHGIDSDS